jgi:formylglycine-generating enzyme
VTPVSRAPGRLLLLLVSLACAVAMGWLLIAGVDSPAAPAAAAAPPLDPAPPPGDAPAGMVWVPPGDFLMGSEEAMFMDARPAHRVFVDGFWMDATEVSNADFARFVDATGYVTVAERPPDPHEFPGAPPELLVPGSIVFTPPPAPVSLHSHVQWWRFVPGASWRHPEGPGSTLEGRMDHPVVHMAYDDAAAYAAWAGRRLPTEAEWERAARGGLEGRTFVWGDDEHPEGAHMANIHQGDFPHHNSSADGYVSTAPVRAFPANGFGLFGMSGNVWEWTTDWYRPDTYARRVATPGEAAVVRNPQGPPDSFDPSEPGLAKRVQKGGSFLCTDQYCGRYRPGGRGKGEPGSASNHVGFRTVQRPGPSA